MKTKNRLLALLLAVFLIFTTVAAANPTMGLIIESVDTEAFPLLTVRLSAWDSNGKLPADLKAQDFQIIEDEGQAIQPLELNVDNDSPLAIALVMDVSGSMRGEALKDAQIAAARFLDRLGPEDQAALIAFSSDVDPNPDNLKSDKEYGFTHDLKPIYDTVDRLQAEGATELYHALEKAIALTAKLPEGHRAVLLLSDGMNDPAGLGDPEIPLQMAKEHQVPVFVIGLGNNFDKSYVESLAAQSGGFVRIAPKSSELAQAFDDIAQLLKTQFVLSYESQLDEAGSDVETEFILTKASSPVSQTISISGLDEKIALLKANKELVDQQAALELQAQIQIEEALQSELPPANPASNLVQQESQEIESIVEEEPGAENLFSNPWLWLGIAAILTVVIFFIANSRKSTRSYQCARCGHKLTEGQSSCPECGETRKIGVK